MFYKLSLLIFTLTIGFAAGFAVGGGYFTSWNEQLRYSDKTRSTYGVCTNNYNKLVYTSLHCEGDVCARGGYYDEFGKPTDNTVTKDCRNITEKEFKKIVPLE